MPEPVRVCPGLRAISVDVGMPVHPEWYSGMLCWMRQRLRHTLPRTTVPFTA